MLDIVQSPSTVNRQPLATSLSGCEWRLRDFDERTASAIAQRHDLSPLLARVLAGRGVGLENAERFLAPSLRSDLPDPAHLLDMDVASERVAAAIIAGEKVAVFGDYDVDGATSSAVLARFFALFGKKLTMYIPDRQAEGYGPNTPALMKLKEQGHSLIVTVDCGTLSFEPLQAAFDAGLDVVVVDHHQGSAQKPKCLALVNPNRMDETSPHGNMAAVGVTFLLCVAVARVLRSRGHPPVDLIPLLDLVALGTVCDVVPLTGANRAFVAQGLKVLASRGNVGLRTLMDVARVDETPGCYHLGFMLGPRVNAGGRVGRADIGARLLTTESESEALALAQELDRHNDERKAIESLVLEDALARAEALAVSHPFLLVASEGWHPGVIGIVAGRLKERHHMPVAVVAMQNGVGKASARSVSGFDLGAAVIAARDSGLLLAGGGHAMAAGFTVEQAQLSALQSFLNHRTPARPRRHVTLDGAISLAGLTVDLARELDQAAPFGQGNASPKLMLRDVTLIAADPVGADGSHLRLVLKDDVTPRKTAMLFRASDLPWANALMSLKGRRVHLAGSMKLRWWQGAEDVTFTVEDAALAE